MATAANPPINDKKEIFSWTMYDWANSAFSTTVGTVFLGPYVTGIAGAAADANGFLHLGSLALRPGSLFAYAVSASVLMQVAFLPVLGALADYSHIRKKLLMFFAMLGSLATMLMFFITDGGHWFAFLLFLIANVSFGASIVFYNAYLPDIASEDRRDHVSASGFAMGYAGGGLLLLLNLVMFMFSDSLGLSGAMVARISLASAGVWWLVFAQITFRNLRSRHAVKPIPEGETYLTIGFSQLAALLGVSRQLVTAMLLLPLLIPILLLFNLPLWAALLPGAGPIGVLIIFIFRKSRTLPEAMKYLVAYLLYNDGIQTVIAVAAIFASEELNMADTNRILVILMIQFVAFGGAYLFSFFAKRMGTKNAILLSLVVWSLAVVFAYFGMRDFSVMEGLGITRAELEFWLLGFVVALILGGSQALSRSLFSQMIPKEQEAEFFSFYEVSERGTSWLGTFVFARVNDLTGSLRLGILSLIFFFFVGLILLPLVKVDKAIEQGKQTGAIFVGASD
ncbi:MAG TPA: MFS transporter [Anaerolineales bacterium]|nr:MFS transporter [Anaerolineales bacterium]